MHSFDFKLEVPQAFPVLNEKQIAVIAEFAERKSYADGDVLFRAGEKDFKFHVIKSGAIEIGDHSFGEPRLTVTHEPGELTGELANLTGRSSNVDAIAKSRRMHDRMAEVGVWLRKVVLGYYQYHAVPGNTTQLRIFKLRVCRLWQSVLVRRSQRAQMRWERFTPILNRWIPPPRVLHPYPDARFYATHPS